MVVTKPISSDSPFGKGQQEAGHDRGAEIPLQGAGRDHRKQLMVTMVGKKVMNACPNSYLSLNVHQAQHSTRLVSRSAYLHV